MSVYVGEIRIFGGSFAPAGWMFCDGTLLPISENETLFQLLGTTFGGDGESTFALPDLRGRVPMHKSSSYILAETGGTETITLTLNQIPSHSHVPTCSSLPGDATSPANGIWAASPLDLYTGVAPDTDLRAGVMANAGGSQPHDNMAPTLFVNFIISLFGIYPSPSSGGPDDSWFIGQLLCVPFDFAPQGWASCNGQLLPINQNQGLFSLLGTTYGGNGQTNFALPDLRGRLPVHQGTSYAMGQTGGAESHTLTVSELGAHVHGVGCRATQAGQAASSGNVWGTSGQNPYRGTVNGAMDANCVLATGGGQAHSNMQPFLTLHWIIALQGVLPSFA